MPSQKMIVSLEILDPLLAKVHHCMGIPSPMIRSRRLTKKEVEQLEKMELKQGVRESG